MALTVRYNGDFRHPWLVINEAGDTVDYRQSREEAENVAARFNEDIDWVETQRRADELVKAWTEFGAAKTRLVAACRALLSAAAKNEYTDFPGFPYVVDGHLIGQAEQSLGTIALTITPVAIVTGKPRDERGN